MLIIAGLLLVYFQLLSQVKSNQIQSVSAENKAKLKKQAQIYNKFNELMLSAYFFDPIRIKELVRFTFEEMDQLNLGTVSKQINDDNIREICIIHKEEEDQLRSFFWETGQAFLLQEQQDYQKQIGLYFWPEGELYHGDFKNGMRDGDGQHYYENGDEYSGQWKNDLPHGYGALQFENGDVYEGQWQNGKAKGFGTYIFQNQDILQGQWTDGKFKRKGSLSTEQYQYTGQFNHDNQPEGFGEMLFFQTNKIQTGTFKKGLAQGQAIETDLTNDEVYIGNFKRGKKSGKGILKKLQQICQQKWHKGNLLYENCSQL